MSNLVGQVWLGDYWSVLENIKKIRTIGFVYSYYLFVNTLLFIFLMEIDVYIYIYLYIITRAMNCAFI